MPQDWQQVKEVLAAALEREPGDRLAYVERVCAEESLRREVESLLAAHAEGDNSFLEGPAMDIEALESGAKLGPYKIVAPLGERLRLEPP